MIEKRNQLKITVHTCKSVVEKRVVYVQRNGHGSASILMTFETRLDQLQMLRYLFMSWGASRTKRAVTSAQGSFWLSGQCNIPPISGVKYHTMWVFRSDSTLSEGVTTIKKAYSCCIN